MDALPSTDNAPYALVAEFPEKTQFLTVPPAIFIPPEEAAELPEKMQRSKVGVPPLL